MSNDFYKKPSFIASGVIILSALFMSLFKITDSGSETASVSCIETVTKGVSLSYAKDMKPAEIKNAQENFWLGMNKQVGIGAIDMLSIFLPLLAGVLMFVAWKGTNGTIKNEYIKPIKISLLAIAGFLTLRYLLKIGITVPGSVSFGPGIGLWLILLASIFIFFEDKIMAAVNANMKK